jgi:hypothetical protein
MATAPAAVAAGRALGLRIQRLAEHDGLRCGGCDLAQRKAVVGPAVALVGVAVEHQGVGAGHGQSGVLAVRETGAAEHGAAVGIDQAPLCGAGTALREHVEEHHLSGLGVEVVQLRLVARPQLALHGGVIGDGRGLRRIEQPEREAAGVLALAAHGDAVFARGQVEHADVVVDPGQIGAGEAGVGAAQLQVELAGKDECIQVHAPRLRQAQGVSDALAGHLDVADNHAGDAGIGRW